MLCNNYEKEITETVSAKSEALLVTWNATKEAYV